MTLTVGPENAGTRLDAFLAALVRWLSGGYDHEMDADEFTSRMKEILYRIAASIPE